MKALPFLMFTGRADEAMHFYVAQFPDGAIEEMTLFGPGEQGAQGTVKRGRFTFAGQTVLCFDSPPVHAFDFTPSFSFFVDVDSEEELDRLVAALGEGGMLLMEPGDYGFSRKFAWLNDRFGVSWQLNWA